MIELLVVIAILAILAALLLPALRAAKERSRSAVCMSNLRQIGQIMLSYADDFGGWSVTMYQPDTDSRWPVTLLRLGYAPVPAPNAPNIFLCPSNVPRGWGWTTNIWVYDFDQHYFQAHMDAAVGDPVRLRHARRGNFLFGDGHVESLSKQNLAGNYGDSSQNYAFVPEAIIEEDGFQ